MTPATVVSYVRLLYLYVFKIILFTIIYNVCIVAHPCQYPAPPVNGERECFETDEGVHCKVYCLEGYAFAIPPADDYFCAYDHKWRPEDKLPIPDCSGTYFQLMHSNCGTSCYSYKTKL